MLVPALVPALVLIVWQVISAASWISPAILPSPLDVVHAAWRLTVSGELATHVGASSRRALIGLLIGGGIGLGLGVINGLSRRADRLLDTTLQMIRNVPHLALIPLVIVWLGIGETAKISLVALGVFFPIYVNTQHGIRAVDPGLVEMARTYGLRRAALFRQVILPGALPSMFVGLRYALGYMWLTLIVAETIAATSGIGYLAMNAREFMQIDILIVTILLYALLGKLADVLVRAMESHWLAWHPAYRNNGAVP